jgi:cbb3-type cytochrome oxidase maturation protein
VNILVVLIPASLFLGLLALAAFFWMLRRDQFGDPEGHAARILSDRYDDQPADASNARTKAPALPPGDADPLPRDS